MGLAKSLLLPQRVSLKRTNKAALLSAKKKLHYSGIQSLFLARRKKIRLCVNGRLRMRNGLARNCGYVRMEDLGCVVDSQGIVVMLEWEI